MISRVAAIVLCASLSGIAYGEETTIMVMPSAPTTTTTTTVKEVATTAMAKPKRTQIYIGESSTDYYHTKGIILGLERSFFNQHMGIGLSYVNYRGDHTQNESGSFYLSGRAINFSRKNANLSADVLFGQILGGHFLNDYGQTSRADVFYGAALTFNYNQEIGVKYTRKESDMLGSEDMVSLVGYY